MRRPSRRVLSGLRHEGRTSKCETRANSLRSGGPGAGRCKTAPLILSIRQATVDLASEEGTVFMRKHAGKSDILKRLSEAEKGPCYLDIEDILDQVSTRDIGAIKSALPRLMQHKAWVIRASAVELVGNFKLTEFRSLVEAGLQDRNVHVRCYALMAYYDLLGHRALPLIREYCREKSVHLRVTAVALCYVITEDETVLKTLKKIVLRRNCDYHHRCVVLSILEHYLDVASRPQLIDMFKAILRISPKRLGISKEIRRKLRTWANEAD